MAQAEDSLDVTTKIEDIEFFERVVLGRGLRPDWATTRLDLLTTDDLLIHIIVGPHASGPDDLVTGVEAIAQKIVHTAAVTRRGTEGKVTIERVDDLDAMCMSFLKSRTNANGRNVILIALGADAQRCAATAEMAPFSFAKLPGDIEMGDEARLGCISRLRAMTNGDGKMTVIAVSPKGNERDINLLRFCLYDRSFSFLGFRGRLIYGAVAPDAMIRSLRSAPRHAIAPTAADMLMMATTYKYLEDGSNYADVRDKIKKSIGKLPPW